MLSALPSSGTVIVAVACEHKITPALCGQRSSFQHRAFRQVAFNTQRQSRRCHRDSRSLQTLCAVKKKSEKSLVCSKTLTVKPEHQKEAVQMCQQVSSIPCMQHQPCYVRGHSFRARRSCRLWLRDQQHVVLYR